MNKYHVHITSNDSGSKKGFKITNILLEKGTIIQKERMFTQTFKGTDDIETDLANIHKLASKFSNIIRFKIELLNNPYYFKKYTEDNYREVHIKLELPTAQFDSIKAILKANENKFGYSLSQNTNEANNEITAYFINLRYRKGTPKTADSHLAKIINFIDKNNIKIKEIKEEVSLHDSNKDYDRFWG